MASSSSSRTGQLIRCPLYPPPTAGILVSGANFKTNISEKWELAGSPANLFLD